MPTVASSASASLSALTQSLSPNTNPSSVSTNHSSHELPYSPSFPPRESDLDFCNAFWSSGVRKRTTNGINDEAEEWGREGVELVWGRIKAGTKSLEDMRAWLRERSTIEDEYAKRIFKLAKHPFGTAETAHLERAIRQAKSELEVQSKAHQDFAAFLRQQDAQIADFVAKRESARKNAQATTEKTWKALANQRNHVLKVSGSGGAKAKYEEDAMSINALHAQASLLQGRGLDKTKLDKAQQTVQVNERDYRNYVGVLKDTTRVWNEAWKNYCDIAQDQEEERVDFVKCRVWDWANGISVVAMAEDDGAERLRTALEQCDATTDIKIFVQQSATGRSIPDPLPFVDFSQKHTASKQTYKIANFKRSSTRIPGVQQTPLAVTDIGRAFQNAPEAIRNPQSVARPELAPIATTTAREQFNAAPLSTSPMSLSMPDPDAVPSRGSGDAALSSEPSRFAVSPSANLKSNAERPISGSSAKAGHAPASAFQRSPSHTTESAMSAARYEGPGQAMSTSATKENLAPSGPSAYTRSTSQAQALSSQTHQRTPSKPTGPGPLDDYETDPILKALEKLHTSQSHAQQLTSPRSSADLRGRQPQSQSSLGQPSNGAPSASSSARPRSPSAMMMQPPPGSQPRPTSRQSSHHPSATSARPRSPSATMMQPPPSSSTGHPSRPSSRQSMNERLAQPQSVGPPPAAATGQNNAGVGARGRSPSPQPFHPNALRPHSPSPNPQRSSSPQPGPQNGYVYNSQSQQPQQQQQQQPQHRGYAAHPPNPPSMVPASYSHHFGSQSNFGQAGSYANTPSTASSHHRVPSGAPPSSVGSFGPPQAQPMYAARAPSPGPQAFSPVAGAISPPPSLQGAYMPQFQPPPPVSASHYNSVPQGYPASYRSSPSVVSIASPYSTVSPAPSQHFQPPPSVVASPSSYAPSPAFSSVSSNSPAQGSVDRKASTYSGVSSVSHASMYAPQQQGFQQQGTYQQHPQHPQQAMSTVSAAGGRPLSTGQVTADGQPIEFYVNALHDYTATMAEEFTFRAGDVIAVTKTEPDGWWHGVRMGGEGQGLFPSNFVEMRT
ncbi:BZ3500_MvSof-1268-A1-R1_Chr2-3g05408 [Microbotryum saponariae]|uniref:BZ3500_MvSof-1268-A1-R1_Chr2-3g05408 protein n=1 Tax=Microbotryum saponariae TaxID=289078 RepID=A0A2X0L708_9BASI|nr:BZ3500_MvSof-1268-A1-R1_Chr2-3g05408 [Microbotryum saponariae]SDA01389.1 BZ3501_MvSof-1269-A2-R1_Chr2-2g05081 [Microbotryum saponariae]